MVVLGLYVASSILMWLQGYVLNGVVQRTVLRLRADVEDKLHALPLRYFDKTPRGELLSRVTNDIDNIQQSMQQTMSQLLNSLFTLVGRPGDDALDLAAARARGAGLGTAVDPRDARRSPSGRSRLFVQQWGNTGALNAHIEETYTGHALVKVFGHQSEAEEQFRGPQRQAVPGELRRAVPLRHHHAGDHVHRQPQLRLHRRGRRAQGGDGQHVARRHAGLHPVLPPVQPAADPGGVDVEPAAVRCRIRRAGLRPARCGGAVARPGAPRGPRRPARGGSSSTNVSFRYVEDAPLIEDLSLVAEPGQTVAIVGPTGAGKTTLVNLMMRFYDLDGGRITLDGVDISTVDARRAARRDRHGAAGHVAVRRDDPREHRVRPAERVRRRGGRRGDGRRTWTGSSTRCPTATTR